MKKIIKLIIFLFLSVTVVGCASKKGSNVEIKKNVDSNEKVDLNKKVHKQAFSLDTVIDIQYYGTEDETIFDKAMELIDDCDNKLSSYKDNSEIYKINNSDGEFVEVSDITLDCIKEGIKYSEKTNGRFDITIGAISLLWDFKNHDSEIPEKSVIEEKLPLVNYKDIEISGNKVRLKRKGMKIDLGAIAKGYIADKVKELLKENKIKSAIINLGGNVYCLGSKNGVPFKVGLQDPDKSRNTILGKIDNIDKSSVTSGIYERYVEKNGVKYHHILDTSTGYPCENSLSQVTIYSNTSVEGDALSTSCFLLGLEDGIKLIDSIPNVEALFITKDENMHFSKNFINATGFEIEK